MMIKMGQDKKLFDSIKYFIKALPKLMYIMV